MNKEEIIEKINQVPFWGHSIPLPHGVVTPGKVMKNIDTFNKLKLPDDLSGKTAIDIGCWDGYFSFECEKRGAEVTAIDNLDRFKRPDEVEFSTLGNKGFETAKEILGSKVKFFNLDVHDLCPEKVGNATFDIVLFLGVLYHLKNPMLALENVSKVTKDMVVIESEYMVTPTSFPPLMRYAEGDTYNEDSTNWFIPNEACIIGMLKDVGFREFEVIYRPKIKKSMWMKSALKNDYFFYGRIILKAWK